ncbi:MAG: type II toxin-antitoxin system PemK/MazF family toxin [Planctomycetaceae bacterium]|nr:type II toxin-antitoxin system PemK/MazF family toxin [Planctomycetaceae bacterium]
MRVSRGDVVLVNYPFASGTGNKVRPALVIQCDRNNGRLENTIIAQITSRTRLARSEPTQILIEDASAAGKQAGLLNDSALSCEKLYKIRQDTIIRKIGTLPPDFKAQVEACLKASLELA